MDIFEYAREYNADYYEASTGYIYMVQAYNRALRLGLPTAGIEVHDGFGLLVGVVCENKESH